MKIRMETEIATVKRKDLEHSIVSVPEVETMKDGIPIQEKIQTATGIATVKNGEMGPMQDDKGILTPAKTQMEMETVTVRREEAEDAAEADVADGGDGVEEVLIPVPIVEALTRPQIPVTNQEMGIGTTAAPIPAAVTPWRTTLITLRT